MTEFAAVSHAVNTQATKKQERNAIFQSRDQDNKPQDQTKAKRSGHKPVLELSSGNTLFRKLSP